MGVAVRAAEVSVTGTAQSLTTLLGLETQMFFQTLALRAAPTNAGDIYIGNSGALTTSTNRGGFLHPDDGLSIDLADGRTSTDQVWAIAASPGDVLHILRFE